MARPRLRALAAGVGAALAIAVPATLLAQVLDATADDGLADVPLLLLSGVVIAGAALGGWVVARRAVPPVVPLGAAAGLLAITVVQGLGVARRLAADEEVAWHVVPGVLLLGTAAAAVAALVSRGRPAR
jgi:predicted permease